jgi:hypothetical protein
MLTLYKHSKFYPHTWSLVTLSRMPKDQLTVKKKTNYIDNLLIMDKP